MNAGPKTARGGKRPSTGVFGQPFAGDLRNVLVPVVKLQNLLRRFRPGGTFAGQNHAMGKSTDGRSARWPFYLIN
jgi:hypothetical protein